MDPHQEKELLDRTRRIETRITKYLESKGFDTQVQKPFMQRGRFQVPSKSTSIHEILKIVPLDWPRDKEIQVWIQDTYLMSIYLQPEDRT